MVSSMRVRKEELQVKLALFVRKKERSNKKEEKEDTIVRQIQNRITQLGIKILTRKHSKLEPVRSEAGSK